MPLLNVCQRQQLLPLAHDLTRFRDRASHSGKTPFMFCVSKQQFPFKPGVRVRPLGVETLRSKVKFKVITHVFHKNTSTLCTGWRYKKLRRVLLHENTLRTDFFLRVARYFYFL